MEVVIHDLTPPMPPGGYTVRVVALDKQTIKDLTRAIERGQEIPSREILKNIRHARLAPDNVADVEALCVTALNGAAYWLDARPNASKGYSELLVRMTKLVQDMNFFNPDLGNFSSNLRFYAEESGS